MQIRTGLSFSATVLIAAFGIFAALTAAATVDDSSPFIGAWQGTWSGDSSGKFEMKITKGSAGKLSGSISPKPDGGDGYTVEFKTVEVASGKLTAKFEDPGGEVEVTLTGSAEGKSAKGTYTARQKSDALRRTQDPGPQRESSLPVPGVKKSTGSPQRRRDRRAYAEKTVGPQVMGPPFAQGVG